MTASGFGRFKQGGRTQYAHRVSAMIRWGVIGDTEVSRTCGNPACCNPDHLELSKAPPANGKPPKPSPDFPLFAHQTKRWAKKVRGKLIYFGSWDDPDAALKKWLAEKDYLLAGLTPPTKSDGLTLHELCNAFCESKQRLVDAGERSPRLVADYVDTCKKVLKAFGKSRRVVDLKPIDFGLLRATLAKQYGPHRLANHITRTRSLFKFGYTSDLLDKPVKFGDEFKAPSKKVKRQHKQAQEKKFFEARHIRRLLKSASPQLRAMILMGINCGFGNDDCGRLPLSAVDLKNGWVDFARHKTAKERRCPLWSETIVAIRQAIERRPKPKSPECEPLVFITKYGLPWHKSGVANPVSYEMRKLLDKLGLRRKGVGFYSLRHTFETVAGNGRDQVAVDFLMGHIDESMAAEYREGFEDDRLVDCVNVVRRWLFRRRSDEMWRFLATNTLAPPATKT